MASSASVCASTKCEFSSCARCHCCDQDLCPDHIKEHKDLLNFKLIPLTDEINALSSGLEHFSFNFDGLEKWRAEAHQTIDDFYERKRQELLEERKKKSREHLQQIQSNVVLLLQKQGATHENIESLTKSIDSIRQQLNDLHRTGLILTPLTIDNNTIRLITTEHKQATPGVGSVTKLQSTTPNMQARNEPHLVQATQNQSLHTEPPKHSQVPQYDGRLTVFVRLEEKIVSIQVDLFDTILQLKRHVAAKEHIPVERQRLSFVGKTLKDEYCVAMTDIQNRSTLDFYYVFQDSQNPDHPAKKAKKK